MILNYTSFLAEKYTVLPTDQPEAASGKAYFNDLEAHIRDYQTHRKELDNIYMTYEDKEDLRKKLQAFQSKLGGGDSRAAGQLQMQANPKDPKSFVFLNPLFNIYSQISAKKRQIKIKEMDLDKQKDTIEDRQRSSAGSEELKASYDQDIESTEEKMSGIKDDIKEIHQQIADLEKQTRQKLKQMMDEFRRNKTNMDARLRQDTAA